MRKILNIIFTVPVSSPAKEYPYQNSWVALVVFVIFLVMIYLILSPGRRRRTRM